MYAVMGVFVDTGPAGLGHQGRHWTGHADQYQAGGISGQGFLPSGSGGIELGMPHEDFLREDSLVPAVERNPNGGIQLPRNVSAAIERGHEIPGYVVTAQVL